jgi:hypothetical protein
MKFRGSQSLNDKFDGSKWRTLNLPHDWAVELPFEHYDSKLRDDIPCSRTATSRWAAAILKQRGAGIGASSRFRPAT